MQRIPEQRSAGARTHLHLHLPDAAAAQRGDELREERGEQDGHLHGAHHPHLHAHKDVGVPESRGGRRRGGGGEGERERELGTGAGQGTGHTHVSAAHRCRQRTPASGAAGDGTAARAGGRQRRRGPGSSLVARVRQALVVLERLPRDDGPHNDEQRHNHKGQDCSSVGRVGGGGWRAGAAGCSWPAPRRPGRRWRAGRRAPAQRSTAQQQAASQAPSLEPILLMSAVLHLMSSTFKLQPPSKPR